MKKIVTIDGMKCSNCANHLKEMIESIKEVDNVEMDLENKQATIEFSKDIKDRKLQKAINQGKYRITSIKYLD